MSNCRSSCFHSFIALLVKFSLLYPSCLQLFHKRASIPGSSVSNIHFTSRGTCSSLSTQSSRIPISLAPPSICYGVLPSSSVDRRYNSIRARVQWRSGIGLSFSFYHSFVSPHFFGVNRLAASLRLVSPPRRLALILCGRSEGLYKLVTSSPQFL